MANQQQTPAVPPPATANVAPNEEQRIAEQRLQDLMNQASTAAADRLEAVNKANALSGELERANAELAGVKAERDRLVNEVKALRESSAFRDTLPTLPSDLPKGAYQLVESVTFATIGEDGKPLRANGRRGDVVMVAKSKDDANELQQAVGVAARVYAVTRQTLDELGSLKHLRT